VPGPIDVSEDLGRGARLGGRPAPELVAAGHRVEIDQAGRLAGALSRADLAHAVALAEGGAIDAPTAAALTGGLLALDAISPEDFPWDPERGDAFNNREQELRRRVGPAASGWLTAGRPRREAFRVALRLVARAGVLDLHDALLDAADALADQAERHAGDLAADYTYLQPAQPTTVGHLLIGYAQPLMRDATRLRSVHAWLDASVAGAGGSAGSRWPLDRARLAELLGCESVARHTKDATWAADGYAELASAVAIALAGLSQLAQDLEILCSREFGAVELADAHSRQSDLMPQKKNPYALPVIRAAAAQAAGTVTAVLTALHTGSARTDHYQVLNGAVPALLDEGTAAARLAAAVVRGMRVDVERMAAAAREGFTVAADVADVVAVEAGVDYRTAHTIVGRAVRRLAEAGLPPSDLTGALLRELGQEVVGASVAIPDGAVAAALDPEACLRARAQAGAATPDEVAGMIDEIRAGGADARGRSGAARRRDELAAARLLDRARELASGRS
jgi:argininosuccinate lyase